MKKRVSAGCSRTAWLLIVACLCFLPACSRESERPDFLQDRANLLSAGQEDRLVEFQRLLLRKRDVHLFVATLAEPAADLDQQALELFEQQALGSRTDAARGLLLVVDPHNRQARIEVGYDLEGLFPDGFIAALEYDQMLPFFQRQRVGDGIEALIELLVARLLDEDQTADLTTPSIQQHLSGGGGARIALTEKTAERQKTGSPEQYQAGASPLETLHSYRDSLARRSKDPQLGIFTPESREFFSQWLVTDAQQQNALRILEAALPAAEVIAQDNRAVIRFPADNRRASPYFLRLAPEGWQLDFVTMTKSIVFNHRNQWHFSSREHPYMFGFSDWRFDTNGFPQATGL